MWQLGQYILIDILILWHYRERMLQIWKAAWGSRPKFTYTWWKWLLLPVFAVILYFSIFMMKTAVYLLLNPSEIPELFNLLTGEMPNT